MNSKNIGKVLMGFGSSPNVKGYHYLKEGLRFCISSPKSVSNLSKLLYPHIAEKFNTTVSAVEKATRNSIQNGWHRRDKALTEAVFGKSLQSSDDVPSNSLFIAAVVEYLREEEE